jgi:hypothetical protein
MICSWEKVESIRLEYKYSVGECLTYREIQIMERHDATRHLDETIQYIQMNFTEQIIEINNEKYLQRRVHSLQIIPDNKFKYDELFQTTQTSFHQQSSNRPAELSSSEGHLLLSSPSHPQFPQHYIQINETWIIPIMNSLGEIQYKLIDINEEQIAHIHFEAEIPISSGTLLTGFYSFHIQQGSTLTQQTISASSALADIQLTKTITRKLLTI